MDRRRSLLPWILSGLMIATASVAATPAPDSAPRPDAPVAQTQAPNPPPESKVQIWECTINGQRTFSDHRCGVNSTLHEIGAINRMDSTPPTALVLAHPYEPKQGSQSDEDSYPSDQEESDSDPQESGYSSYPLFIGVPVHQHGRQEHHHQHSHHPQHPQHGHHGSPPPHRN